LPSHRFLWSYGLELHHRTPLGILHMAAFVTLCEAYIGIEHPLNMWNHIFQTWLWHDSCAGASSLGSVDISVHSGPRVGSYFSILQPNPPVGWRKAWFLLKDEADASLPVFTGSCTISHPDWENGVAQANFP
jgi:hypothetical protein